MAFRFPDPRLRVEEDYTTAVTAKGSVARTATTSNSSTTRESPPNGVPPLEVYAYNEATDGQPIPSPKRKNIVFADPFAFRYDTVEPKLSALMLILFQQISRRR